MASSFSKDQLRKEINSILKNADLNKTTAKEVRLQLQDKLKVDFTSRKKELDKLIMQAVNAMQDSESDGGRDEDEEEEEESEPEVRRSVVASKKRKAADDSDEGSDYKPSKSAKGKKKRASSDVDSDDDWKETKKKKKGKGTGFTRPYKLSPALSELMGGSEELPRHEVVKKVWKIIKEKNLYDPKNKQFAICDEQLEKVIGVKRFRTFGMMKYLMPHFIK